MELFLETIKFLFYSFLIVLISKYLLVVLIRKFAITLNLKAKTVGNITGISTSIPELLSVCFSAYSGFIGASLYNILSSNIINLVQYIFSILFNKNEKSLKNTALKIDLILVLFTIIIPMFLCFSSFNFSSDFIIAFILLFILFYFINKKTHHLYLPNTKNLIEEDVQKEKQNFQKRKALLYIILLILTTILLFFIGNLLSLSLENLCIHFRVPEFIIGIALGFITSLPELITFFEAQKHHKQHSLESQEGVIEATNNLLTSNIINLFIIQSIGIFISNLWII